MLHADFDIERLAVRKPLQPTVIDVMSTAGDRRIGWRCGWRCGAAMILAATLTAAVAVACFCVGNILREGTTMGYFRNVEDAAATKFPVSKTDEEWRAQLTAAQYNVCRAHGTERAFTGAYWDAKTPGTYLCVCCGNELFRSVDKFDSGTGWPSFTQPIADERVGTRADNSWFARRTEAYCNRCGAHLGHVFDDGPAPTGLRYCMNSAALRLEESAL